MKVELDQTSLGRVRREDFLSASPIPMVVTDDFLPANVAHQLADEATAYTIMRKSNDYIFAKNKFEEPRLELLGEAGRAVRELFLSESFTRFLSGLYGSPIFIDPAFVGGGLHRGGEGSYLDMHADFNVHPTHKQWIRELNLLLYLNRNWKPEHGGQLELKNAITGATASIEPLFNRLVIMLTKDFTLHGYRPIRFPKGTFRTSIAAYAYSEAPGATATDGLRTTTTWIPEGSPVKRAVARVTPWLVSAKQRLFGSATARKGHADKD